MLNEWELNDLATKSANSSLRQPTTATQQHIQIASQQQTIHNKPNTKTQPKLKEQRTKNKEQRKNNKQRTTNKQRKNKQFGFLIFSCILFL